MFLLGSQPLNYAAFADMVARIASSLLKLGIGRGDRVVIVAENCVEVVLLAFATMRVGGMFVILSPQTKAEGLRRVMAQCTPKLVMLDAETDFLGGEIDSAKLVRSDTNFEALIGEDSTGVPGFPGIDQDPAFLVFTSGSTGAPRGVILSHDNVVFVSAAIQARLGYEADDRIAVFLPMSFDVGLYQLFLAMQVGAAVLLNKPQMAGPELQSTLATHAISVLPGVPTLFAALIKLQSRRAVQLPALRVATNTGDHLPVANIEKLHALFPGLRVFPMYGLTECKRISILLPEEWRARPDSVGRALDGTEVFAVDTEGRTLQAGEVGELVVRGRHLAQGYWAAEEETAKRYRSIGPGRARVMFTGDMGRVDEEGYIYFVGRGDFLIKHRGHRMSPLEIEEAACAIPGIVAAGVVRNDADSLLHLYLETSVAIDADAVTQWLRERLEEVKVPECIHFVTALPKSANLKLDRKALRTLLAQP
ncbi:MAG: AMP-binding protein [Verrucomicrobia bacterium]|nr:AMP-binding protein [Verrucomicrobiota bacterium]